MADRAHAADDVVILQELLVVRAGELERGQNELNPMFEEGG